MLRKKNVTVRAKDITFDSQILSRLKDISPPEMGQAATCLRIYFAINGFNEIRLNPFTNYPLDYEDEAMDVPGIGQLRFNTEPEVWEYCRPSERFFSISPLFRKEKTFNLLRRPAFTIVDFYQPGPPDSMWVTFKSILKVLTKQGMLKKIGNLPVRHLPYDDKVGGPRLDSSKPCWVITSGYSPSQSFFETDAKGDSTRTEVFLVTPRGFLEIGACGIVGWNRNPDYVFRRLRHKVPKPIRGLSGMGFGLERLLLAEQIFNMRGL